MLAADEVLMKRAIELAGRGAGMVSPNPMVGAVLMKDGRVVGEGYHRYDKLKHAESYAIELAGDQARGATLYCNLEPCSHHGRTPPCTDALIEAGIARAVVAIKDPDRRVNGKGIDQLRAAGIEVEVGLCEIEALRLNESYLKFAADGLPFVHGVIECDGRLFGATTGWISSDQFIQRAADFDAVVLGWRNELNRRILETRLASARHRSMVIVLTDQTERELERAERQALAGGELIALELDSDASGSRGNNGPRGNTTLKFPQPIVRDTESLFQALAKLQVTNVLVLRGVLDPVDPVTFEQLDKITFTVPDAFVEGISARRLAIADLEFDFEDVTVVKSDGYTELTGYPSVRGVA
jgi:diaminohydroxyphosphoribosylaminopyrimidine deaminase / 5-amino-6-(5-phosphoribosylamino)uracil reductase